MTDRPHKKVSRRRNGSRTELLEKVRLREAQYKLTIDSLTDALHVVDRDLRIILINSAFLDWHARLGLSKDVLGKRLGDIYPFLPAGVHGEYSRVVATGEALITEESVRIGDSEIATETRKIPVMEGGEVTQIITIVRDVTARKRMEHALRQSEANFRALADQSPNMIFVNSRGRITYVNKKCMEALGYTRAEFYDPGFDFYRLIAPESVSTVAEGYVAYLEGRKPAPHECALITKSGLKLDCIITTEIVEFLGESALLGVVTDITDRKRTEEALRTSEEKYRSFVENFHGIAYRGGLDGRPIFFHGDVRRITGYTEEELLNSMPKWIDIVHPEDRKMLTSGAQALGSPDSDLRGEIEYRIIRGDGETRWIHQSMRPVLDSSGEAIYLQGALYDVTGRKSAEETVDRERSAFRIITEAALASADEVDVCRRVVKELPEMTGFEAATARLYEAGTGHLRLVAVHGVSPGDLTVPVEDQHIDDPHYIAAMVGRTRQPVWAPDVSVSDRLAEYRQRLMAASVRSIVSWPLLSARGALLGVFHLFSTRVTDIPQEKADFFRTVFRMLALVLERKKAEAALRDSEWRYRSRFESSP
jgi:PAS domain S-box-containing protein